MEQLSKSEQEIVRRAWDKLDQTAFGYVPLNDAADGFYAYAKLSLGNEWSLITAVKAQLGPKAVVPAPEE